MAGWRFWIDQGGTFTDVVARAPDGTLRTAKILSAGDDSALRSIRTVLGLEDGAALDASVIEEVRIGTTVATNALLERRGAATVLVVDHGFEDLLAIGDQSRPDLFARAIVRPAPLHGRVIGVGGRIAADGTVVSPFDAASCREALDAARADGFVSVAIALAHGWRHPDLERRVAALARDAGFAQVSCSHAVAPLPGLVRRAETTEADAYLAPVLSRHVARLASGLEGVRLRLMQSSGGLVSADALHAVDAVLSGPAGGVVGGVRTAAAAGFDRVIGFDMGGTSTDIWLRDDASGGVARRSDTRIAGVRLGRPMLAIDTIAAGGGSVLEHRNGRFRVGPRSAGASPGPACYGRGGPLTVTDANLRLGRLQPARFPPVFGPDGKARLDPGIVVAGFDALAGRDGAPADPLEVASGFVAVAVADMARAIRRVAIGAGADCATFALACFGGAGGQHACLVAEELGIGTIVLHRFGGMLSAYGIGLADEAVIRERAIERPLDDIGSSLEDTLSRLRDEAVPMLGAAGPDRTIAIRRRARLRLAGRDLAFELDVPDPGQAPGEPVAATLGRAFAERWRDRFGFEPKEDATLIVEAASVEAILPGPGITETAPVAREGGAAPPVAGRARLWSAGAMREAALYERDALRPGDRMAGPALVFERGATIVMDLGWSGEIGPDGALVLRRRQATVAPTRGNLSADAAGLSLFHGIFMRIAETMGEQLRVTASSVNIRERLDYSCALFDPSGALIANAPHVPVHLGAMGASVRHVIARAGAELAPGSAFVVNDPSHGGTHLPDVTLVCPFFVSGQRAFLVASRAHHADLGGTAPGSTPHDSRRLDDEGVVFELFQAVADGVFDEEGFRRHLAQAVHPARNPDLNVADLIAQLAANRAGLASLEDAVARFGFARLQAFVRLAHDNAADAMRRCLARLAGGTSDTRLDGGARLRVAVSIDAGRGRAIVDFSGSSGPDDGNFNAPEAVVRAVVLYVLRCLIDDDIPLNDGCLAPVEIILPHPSFLSPPRGAAVVAGNTEISQAVANAMFAALRIQADAQGTMNNLTFGNETFQYYETICGGTGAGPGFDGADAVQSHMTNTRMTDVETIEMRLPVRVETFAIRRGSGGAGARRGGDGAIRRLLFLAPMSVVLVSSNRERCPQGLEGGGDALPGRQWLERADGARSDLRGRMRVEVAPGDRLVIETPGGGGFGAA